MQKPKHGEKVEIEGASGTYKDLPTAPPPGASMPQGGMMSSAMEATVDYRPQELRRLRPFHKACQSIPPGLGSEGQIVLQALLSCFEKAGYVSEGVVEDVFFGFEAIGIPRALTRAGLSTLRDNDLVSFETPDGVPARLGEAAPDKTWVRYGRKLLDIAHE